jgi:hypothetical protein
MAGGYALTSRSMRPICPALISRSPKRAVVEAIRRSQSSAMPCPPPTQSPLMAAMIGFAISCWPGSPKRRGSRRSTRGGCFPSRAYMERSFRSAPAQNARPAPVTIATRSPSSFLKACQASPRSWWSCSFSEFSASGRFMVMTTTSPCGS